VTRQCGRVWWRFEELSMVHTKHLRRGAAIVFAGCLINLPVVAFGHSAAGAGDGAATGAPGAVGGTTGVTGTTATGVNPNGTSSTSTGIGGTGTSTGIGGTTGSYTSAMPMPGSVGGTTSSTTATTGAQLPTSGSGPGGVGPYPANSSGAYTNPNCAIAGSSCYSGSTSATTLGVPASPATLTTTPNASAGTTPK
jgi:hypothetical protein